jgi:hypothetical protein
MEKFTVKVPGLDFKLSSNQFYQIREISDADAPSGYKEKSISKHPLPGIEENFVVPYDVRTTTWNTGFYPTSACFNSETTENRDNTIKEINKHLVPVISKMVTGDITDYSPKSDILFDNFIPLNGNGFGDNKTEYKIKGNNIFDTKDPLKFLALYWGLINGDIAPPGQQGNPKYKGIPYVLEDKRKTSTVNEDQAFLKTKAMSKVFTIMEENKKPEKEFLQNMLTYLGLDINLSVTKEKTVISSVSGWMSAQNGENAADFNSVYKEFSDKQGREKLHTYIDLIKHIKSGKISVERKEIFIDGVSLGMDKKQAANKIYADKELYKKFLSID